MTVNGRRSPRWAIWAKMTIPCQNGDTYLVRRRVLATPWFGVYVHDIYEPDGDRDPHDHPWPFVSVVLRGSYREWVYPDPAGNPTSCYARAHRRWSAHRMGTSAAHRIIVASPGLKTLIFVGPRRGSWGFYVKGRFVPWDEYERERGTEPVVEGLRP